MRVALFFDGKNHMKDLRRASDDVWIDHSALAKWAVEYVGGTRFVAAYYYTGVPHPNDEAADRRALSDLLDELERRPGFFVRRFTRRVATRECPHCHHHVAYTEEKMVDTSLVAELIHLAVADAYDVAVIFSGDLDLAPGFDALHALGKQAWVATFGDQGLSKALTKSAWAHIDLQQHFAAFAHADLAEPTFQRGDEPGRVVAPAIDDLTVDEQMVRELQRAEAHFGAGGGFVGAHYFLHRWKGHGIPDNPEDRRQSVQRLINVGSIISYSVDGKTALRAADDPTGPLLALRSLDDDLGELDEDETVEIRVTDTIRRLRAKLPQT